MTTMPFAPLTHSALPGLQVQLLARAPYSASDPVQGNALGIALERQRGVHAIGTDRRTDFDTWPGTLSHTPPGVDVFSESATGGEYLVLRWDATDAPVSPERISHVGHSTALQTAQSLRRMLLAAEPDALAIEQAALVFLQHHQQPSKPVPSTPREQLRPIHARVLDRIAADFAQPLTIADLAQGEGRTPLQLLREFARFTGMTPHAFIVETRVQAARRMIQHDTATLAEIATDCGFTHQSHMGLAFRKVLGMTPGQYLAQCKTPSASAFGRTQHGQSASGHSRKRD